MRSGGGCLLAIDRCLVVLGVVALGAVGACLQESGEPGRPSGPSELGLSLSLMAVPDRLPADGAAEALVGILARDAEGVAVPGVVLSLQIATPRGLEDFGRLSARRVVTGPDGRASATYTAPTVTPPGPQVDAGEIVTIAVTPIDGDFASAVSRSLTIRLVPPGRIIPPFSATPGLTFIPAMPAVFHEVRFSTACLTVTSTDCVRDPERLVRSYRWEFGDGRVGSGPTASHTYLRAGTYVVTLTIRDANGRFAEATEVVVVAAGTPPTAVLSVSPTDPEEGDEVFFNASGSTAAPDRTIVSRRWDFGDGSTGSGVAISHVYHAARTYTVTLSVVDDRGQIGTVTAWVVVAAAEPIARFGFSLADCMVARTVACGGQLGVEVRAPDRRIVRY